MTQTRLQRHHRFIIKRIIVRGQLILDTPTCLGNGDIEADTDLALLHDSIEDKALLTGASIAGALRNYLREYQNDYEGSDISQLFGGSKSDEDGDQSPVIVNNALSSSSISAELRDGVKIKSETGTADKGAKYDLELLESGTIFNLFFELLIDQGSNEAQLIEELAIAFQGLEEGEISIGMKKRRGFGRCHVEKWQVWQFDMTNSEDRLAWLTFDRHWVTHIKQPDEGKIFDILKPQNTELDKRDRLTISATFNLASPILIRSGQADTKPAPDVVHLKSNRPRKNGSNGEESKPDEKNLVPILSGTSLAGVLRHRAERIVKTLQCASGQNPGSEKEPEIVKSIFGDVSKTRSQASRLVVHESVIENVTEQNELVQTRIAIDRFTGGAYPGALFQEQPVFNSDNTDLKLDLELRQPKEHEIGLLLLLLKDLWTEDLSVGGSSSIGRGRLKGKEATITWQCSEKMQWEIKQDKEKLQVSGSIGSEDSVERKLETFVKALNTYVKQEEKP